MLIEGETEARFEGERVDPRRVVLEVLGDTLCEPAGGVGGGGTRNEARLYTSVTISSRRCGGRATWSQ